VKQALQFIEADLPYCANVYGTAPCTAAIGVTGAIKCVNSPRTCQDRAHYVEQGATLRFAVPTDYLPDSIECFPHIISISHTSQVVSLGKDLGQRAILEIVFADGPDTDTGAGFDKYLADRGYDPVRRGTLFGKMRARQPYLRGRPLRWINGYVGQALADMETRHFLIESFSGPDADGRYTIVATDVLIGAAGDRAQAPRMSEGYLIADITAVANSVTLAPAGIGASYPGEGYLNLGGNEIARYWYSGLDQYVSLLLHCEGADGSTTFTDSSPLAKTVVVGGNAQIDTAQFKFGSASALFDGTGDYLRLDGSAAFAFGAGDFTIDFWLRRNVTGATHYLYDARPAGTDGLYPTLYVFSDNVLYYYTNGANRIAGGSLSAGVWYHIALTRQAGQTRLFVNGVQVGSTYADTNTYLNGAQRPSIGISGLDLAGGGLNGWLDEIRVSKDFARWAAAFTAPAAPAPIATDTFNLPGRGMLNTVAATHKAQDRAQWVLRYVGQRAADILRDLFVTYAGEPAGYIDQAAWQAEDSAFNGNVYTATIPEPTPVEDLASELIEQAALATWWDDIDLAHRLQVLRGVATDSYTFTPDDFLPGSMQITEQPDLRVSRVQVYFGQVDPTKPLTNVDNYRSNAVTADTDAEDDYGSAAYKTIFSRWIPELGRTVAERLGDILLGRFTDPPRHFAFDVMRYAEADAVLGGGYQVQHPMLQDETGAADSVPIQVTQLGVSAAGFHVEAEEMLFEAAPLVPGVHTIIIDANNSNINLRTAHDSIYPAPQSGDTINVTINASVVIGSSTNLLPAIDVGTWPGGVTINVTNLGRIAGAGGRGGNSDLGSAGGAGAPGGAALYTRQAINLINAAGVIAGGGGGGGGCGGSAFFSNGAGGGGAGQLPGPAGVSSASAGGVAASPGTLLAGGAAGTGVSGNGGNGGAPGTAGIAGDPGAFTGGAGGAAGAAIDGISYVTVISAGSQLGPTIN
jgi:hypothetical protein